MLKGLIACGAAIALLAAGLIWQTHRLSNGQKALGEAERDLTVCRDTTAANETAIFEFKEALDACIGESNVVESERLADPAIRRAEVERLRQRVESLQVALRQSSGSDDCGPLRVPGDAVERLRDAADRAHRAGREEGAPVGPDSS